jgi:hypothetical protein
MALADSCALEGRHAATATGATATPGQRCTDEERSFSLDWSAPLPLSPLKDGDARRRLISGDKPGQSMVADNRGSEQMPQYKVVELKESLIGGKMSGDKLEKVLNEHGSKGWTLKSITSVEVKGRVGPGGVEGILVTFEK